MLVKSLNNFSNAKPNDHQGFKEELKIKYDAIMAVIRLKVPKLSNRIGTMMELLKAERPPRS